MNRQMIFAASVLALAMTQIAMPARAKDITVMSAAGMQAVLTELQPIYEHRSGNGLIFTFMTSAQIVSKIEQGAAFDVAVLFPMHIDALTKEGKIASGTAVPLAKAGQGVAIKAGLRKPVLKTPEQFKAMLIAAKNIAYLATGQSGVYFEKLIAQLGIADEVNPKTKKVSSGSTATLVADGEADISVQLLPELAEVKGVQLIPFPPALQTYASYKGGIGAGSADKKTDAAFLKFLISPVGAKAIKAKSMDLGN